MSSFVYDAYLDDVNRGRLDLPGDRFKAMLVTAQYAPDKEAHARRSDVTGETAGAGYAPGGVDVSIAMQTAPDMLSLILGGVTLQESSITAKGAIYYKSNGGAAADDELLAFIDFEQEWSSLNGRFAFADSVIQTKNPKQLML